MAKHTESNLNQTPDDCIRAENSRAISWGFGFWILFSIAVVLIRGVRWDETYEHALAITRIAPYPLDHPFYIYTRNIYSFQSYFSAGILLLTKSAFVVCFVRDVMQLLCMTVPLYLLAIVFCGRAIWGHVAVILGLCGAYVFFESHYAIETWPGFFSVGQIGAGYATLVFAAFLGKWRRTSWFLLTFLLAVHPGQLPPLILFASFWLLYGDAEHRKREFRAALTWGGLGFALSIGFLLLQRTFAVPYPNEGSYFAEGNAAQIWLDYSSSQDVHRFIEYIHPFSYSMVLIGIVALLSGLGSMIARTKSDHSLSVLVYAIFIGVISIGVWLVQQTMGDDIPFLLIGWMPYRIPNHLAPILLCMTLGILAKGSTGKHVSLWPLILTVMAFPIAMDGRFIPEGVYNVYIAQGEFIVFCLLGAAIAALQLQASTRFERGTVLGASALLVVLIFFGLSNMYVVACMGLGAFLHVALMRVPEYRLPPPVLKSGTAALIALVLITMIAREWTNREHLPRTAFQQGVVDYLEDVRDTDATIIPPIWEVEWGARTGSPIFIDYQTPRLITYIPKLGPSLKKMHQDVYGFSIDGSSDEGLQGWAELNRDQWKELSEGYGISYLVHPSDLPINLDAVYSSDGLSLYKLPDGE